MWGIQSQDDGKDCAPLPPKEREIGWACLAIFFLVLGLDEIAAGDAWNLPSEGTVVGGSGSARRRRERRLRSFLRHEWMAVAMTLAESTHHSAPQGQKKAGAGRRYELKSTASGRTPSPSTSGAALRGRLRAGPRHRSAVRRELELLVDIPVPCRGGGRSKNPPSYGGGLQGLRPDKVQHFMRQRQCWNTFHPHQQCLSRQRYCQLCFLRMFQWLNFSPAPAVSQTPAPVIDYFSPSPAVLQATAPVEEYLAPAPVLVRSPAPVVEYILLSTGHQGFLPEQNSTASVAQQLVDTLRGLLPRQGFATHC